MKIHEIHLVLAILLDYIGLMMIPQHQYPLVNIQKTMENHHVYWENPLFLWPFSIANCLFVEHDILVCSPHRIFGMELLPSHIT
jgi:hypothetical protein